MHRAAVCLNRQQADTEALSRFHLMLTFIVPLAQDIAVISLRELKSDSKSEPMKEKLMASQCSPL